MVPATYHQMRQGNAYSEIGHPDLAIYGCKNEANMPGDIA